MIALTILLILGILLEASLTMLPLTLAVLVSYVFFFRNSYFMAVAFIAGIILDSLTLKTFGLSSVFFLVVFSVLNLYERKLEPTPIIVFLISLFASLIYIFVAYSRILIFDSIIAAFISVLIFQTSLTLKTKNKNTLELRYNG